jgi:DNA polymerase III alpha subunit
MITDKYGQFIYDENDLCDIYMSDPARSLQRVLTTADIKFNTLNLRDVPELIPYNITEELSVEAFDARNRNEWYIPDEYRDFDIARFILDQCKTDAELQRAGEELLLYQERDLFMMLRYLKYFVDTMRKHKIVWGVGRGSSVSSFVLYLIGVHRINALYYDLSIYEFLK